MKTNGKTLTQGNKTNTHTKTQTQQQAQTKTQNQPENQSENQSTARTVPMIDLMNVLLADLQVFQQAMRSFHWNIQGEHFFDLHAQFGRVYKEMDDIVDEFAERIKVLGYYPLSNLGQILKHSKLEAPANFMTTEEMIQYTIRGLDKFIRKLTELTSVTAKTWEVGTTDLLSSIVRKLEVERWKWRSVRS